MTGCTPFLADVDALRDTLLPLATSAPGSVFTFLSVAFGLLALALAFAHFALGRDAAVPVIALAIAASAVVRLHGWMSFGADASVNGWLHSTGYLVSRSSASLLLLAGLLVALGVSARSRRSTATFAGIAGGFAAAAILAYLFVGGSIGSFQLALSERVAIEWRLVTLLILGAALLACGWRYHRRVLTGFSSALLVAIILQATCDIATGLGAGAFLTEPIPLGSTEIRMGQIVAIGFHILGLGGALGSLGIVFRYPSTPSDALVETNGEEMRKRDRLRKANAKLRQQSSETEDARSMLEASNQMLREQGEELARAREEADKASAAKSEFLAHVSHELRTPMTAILCYAEELLDVDISDEDQIDAAQTIYRNGEHLLAVVNDILDLAQVEARKLTVEPVPVAPCDLVQEIDAILRRRAEDKGLSFVTRAIGAVPESIETDPVRLRQILINLATNAVKFTSEGEVRVEYELVRDSETAPRMFFRVVDTGRGLAPDQLERIFEPFTQAEGSPRGDGAGLGLSISQQLAELLGGAVHAESEPGVGSCFWVEIPVGDLEGVRMVEPEPARGTLVPKAASSAAARDPKAASSAAARAIFGEGAEALACRILLADDNDSIRLFLRRLLTLAGAEVVEVGDGRTAVDMTIEAASTGDPFDVVLMDVQMPGLDGLAATSELRTREYDGSIIALTAGAMHGDRDRYLAAGYNDCTTKPIDRDHLFEAIRGQLDD